jgi:propanediol utilization protein
MDKSVIENIVREVISELDIKSVCKNYIPENSVKCENSGDKNTGFEIPVSVSNRHVHLSEKDLEILFGKGYKLTKIKDLSQPGQFAAKETVIIAGPKGVIEKVRILGPTRKQTQVEVSMTDTYKLGVKAPVRDSGDLIGSAPITIIGPKGSVYLSEGLIIAKRHIHMTTYEASRFNLRDKQIVKVKIVGERGGIFDEVLVRVSDNYALDMHIDTDEANAFGITGQTKGVIIV